MYTLEIPEMHCGPSSLMQDKKFAPAHPRVTDDFARPIVTSKWWTGALWAYHEKTFCEPLYAHPMVLQPAASGLGLCYPTQLEMSADMLMYSYPYNEDMCVGLEGLNSNDVQVADYSDWTATLQWQDEKCRLQAIAGHGLPYVYFERFGTASVRVRFTNQPEIWSEQGDTLAVTLGDRHYGLFGPTDSHWIRVGPCEWTNDLDGKSYWSVAVLPAKRADTLTEFRRHAHVVVTDTRVEWDYDQANSTVHTHFTTTTKSQEGIEEDPLLALYPHQWKNTLAIPTDHRFGSPRGIMKVLRAREFSTNLRFSGLLPFMPTPDEFDSTQLWQMVESVGSEDGPPLWPKPLESEADDDVYWSGKALGRLSELAHIADAIGHHNARERFLAVIRDKLASYFDGSDIPCFYYDRTWHSLIFYPAAAHGQDTALNDHQYAYGYFLKAVATLLHFDPQWWHEGDNKDMVHALVKSVANPDRHDAVFPFLRHFDVYAGHSWGSGAAPDYDGLNAEPSSEAIHFAHALILLGLETGEQPLRDLGIFLATSEIAAAEQYWFNIDGDVFPNRFPWPVAGIVWGSGARYGTWWQCGHEEIHGINMVPMQAGSLYLGRWPGHAQRAHERMQTLIGGTPRNWRDIHWMHQALYDPSAALSAYQAQPDYSAEWGTSEALTYHWLHSLNQYGIPDTTVWADTPCYHVFHKDKLRHYVAYNAGAENMQVRFSDGTILNVPPYVIAVKAQSIEQHLLEPLPTVKTETPIPLRIEMLSKAYRVADGSEVKAVCNISMQVQAGKCVGLLGANGAGKSTTIACVTGLYQPTSGHVWIAGNDVHRQPRKARHHLGVCTQDETLDTDLSVLEQLLRHAAYFRIPKNIALPRALALLECFGLTDRANASLSTLSGGMRRVLQVSRALISEPDILVLDEPSTGLDPEVRRLLWDVLKQRCERGLAILLTTHYMEEAQYLCDEVAVMHKGIIVDHGTVADLIGRHVPGYQISEEIRPGITTQRPATLEDVYLRIVGGGLIPGKSEVHHAV